MRAILRAGADALAAAMLAVGNLSPAMGGTPTPRFERAVDYDGLGRKVKAKRHPRHNAGRVSEAFRKKVEATHRFKPDGSWNEDPRDDKYLHSHARSARGARA